MKNLLNTELPKRFTDAVSKLYNAFHSGKLQLTDCKKCAVGNICNNSDKWFLPIRSTNFKTYSMVSNPLKENEFVDMPYSILKFGYSAFELAQIEHKFAKAMVGDNEKSKSNQFKGLCVVVEYLCELDNIPNIMDIQSLFEFENDQPKKQLSEVLILN